MPGRPLTRARIWAPVGSPGHGAAGAGTGDRVAGAVPMTGGDGRPVAGGRPPGIWPPGIWPPGSGPPGSGPPGGGPAGNGPAGIGPPGSGPPGSGAPLAGLAPADPRLLTGSA